MRKVAPTAGLVLLASTAYGEVGRSPKPLALENEAIYPPSVKFSRVLIDGYIINEFL